MLFRVFTYLSLLAIFSSSAFAANYVIVLDHVIDGDTIRASSPTLAKSEIFRLAEIDAPETMQPFGRESKKALSSLLSCNPLRVEDYGLDHYGRHLATVYCEDENINLQMVKIGAAWAYPKYLRDKSYPKAEAFARENLLGLWAAGDAKAPWNWRQTSRK